MGYINDLGKELEARILALEEIWRDGDVKRCDKAISEIVQFVKDKVLESYRNGQESNGGRKNFAKNAKGRGRGN